MNILETYLSLDTYNSNELKLLIETHDEPANKTPRFQPENVLQELVDYDDEQILELLDALLVLNADSVENAMVLLEAFLASYGCIGSNSSKETSEENNEIEPIEFKVLND